MGTVRVLIANDVVGIAEDGLEAVGLVVLSASDDPTLAEAAHSAGAKGYLTKDRIASGLRPALLAAAEAPARLSGDGSAELAGRARVG